MKFSSIFDVFVFFGGLFLDFYFSRPPKRPVFYLHTLKLAVGVLFHGFDTKITHVFEGLCFRAVLKIPIIEGSRGLKGLNLRYFLTTF